MRTSETVPRATGMSFAASRRNASVPATFPGVFFFMSDSISYPIRHRKGGNELFSRSPGRPTTLLPAVVAALRLRLMSADLDGNTPRDRRSSREAGAMRGAEGGGWRTRGRSGSSAASVVSLAETLFAEGSGLSRHIDLRVADATTPRRTARASSPPTDAAMPHGGFSLAAMRQSLLHTCFTGVRQFSCLRKWGNSMGARFACGLLFMI